MHECGRPADGPFDHTTGTGWVKARKGYYHDAIHNKGNTVLALISEDSGGVTAVVTALLRRLAKKTTVRRQHPLRRPLLAQLRGPPRYGHLLRHHHGRCEGDRQRDL